MKHGWKKLAVAWPSGPGMTGPGSEDLPGDELVSGHGPLLAPGVGPEHADTRLRGGPLGHGQHHRKLVGPRQPVDGAVERPRAGGGPACRRCRPTHPMSGQDGKLPRDTSRVSTESAAAIHDWLAREPSAV